MREPSLSLCAGLLIVSAACATPRPEGRDNSVTAPHMQIALSISADRHPDQWRGMSNIFFDSVPVTLADSVKVVPSWRNIAIADVVAGPRMHAIRALRFTATAADTQYVIDTLGDLDFRRAARLVFQRRGAMRVASVDLTVRGLAGTVRRVPYQLLLSDDRYSYARIAEYRTGMINVDGRSFAVRVRNRGRSHPFYADDDYTVFMFDLNGDGEFAEQAQLSMGGHPVAAEQVMPHRPFFLNGHAFEVSAIDSVGTRLQVSRSARASAVAPHFRAPELRAPLLLGGEFRLSAQRGSVTLIEFWATNCPYSERVRTALNALADSGGPTLHWIAIARERDSTVIQQHLAVHPMNATVTMADSAAWETYNPIGATPTFIIVDQQGTVQFVASGASAISAVSAKVVQMLPSWPHR